MFGIFESIDQLILSALVPTHFTGPLHSKYRSAVFGFSDEITERVQYLDQ